jgi:phosphohistidine phosphatase SixA
LLRARETAEILLDVYGVSKLHVSDALANGNHEALFADANALRGQTVVAVGHEPFISQALAFALTGNDSGLTATFKKGAAALLTFDGPAAPGKGLLEWLIQPAGLRAIGGSGGQDLGND